MSRGPEHERASREQIKAWFDGTDPDLRMRILGELTQDAASDADKALKRIESLRKGLNWNAALVLSICVAVLTGWNSLADKTKAAAAEVDKKLEKHETQENAEIREVRADIKALYQVILTRKKNERLEKPLPDGGIDD